MLSQELRPSSFAEMAGQEENIKILKAVIKNPTNAPKCLIFAGAFGSGKTTSARILVRELNHLSPDVDLLSSQYYYEFDSTVVGNVDTIRSLRDQFTVSYGDYYRVIVLDECHAISNAAQNALLKMFEEAQGKVFYVLCTTEINKLLPTIRSRSLELTFEQIPKEEIIRNLTEVSQSRNFEISDEIKMLIADRSNGHMRNAHMLLDKYLLLGEEDFKDSIKSSISLYCKFLASACMGNKDGVLTYINDLMNIPKDDLQSDWGTVMTECMRGFCGYEVRHPNIQTLVDIYKKGGFQNVLIQCFMSPWMKNAFIDMPYFQATFLNLYLVVNQEFNKRNATQEGSSNVNAGTNNQQMANRALVRR